MTDTYVLPTYTQLHTTGQHCGSTAMLNLLRFHTSTTIDELSVLGLSGSLWFCLLWSPLVSTPIILGRTITLETGICEALQLPYSEQSSPDAQAWSTAKEALHSGTPVVLMGDSSQLDYFGGPPFPGHRFLLVGYDEPRGVALIGDRKWADLQEVSFASLARSRSAPGDPLSAQNLWGAPTDPWPGAAEIAARANAAVVPALGLAAARMLDPCVDSSGVAGIRTMARRLVHLEQKQLAALAATNAFMIAKGGNAGGFFRRMYARFIRNYAAVIGDVANELAEHFETLGDSWAEMATLMDDVAQSEHPSARVSRLVAGLEGLAEQEQAAWSLVNERWG